LEFRVKEGQRVKEGDTLVFLDSPDVHAKLAQAEAAENAAQAQNLKAQKGTRVEQINSAYEMWQKAKAGLDVAEKTYNRMQNLFEKGVISAQNRDEAEANYLAMKATENAALFQYQMAKNGAEKEDKMAAEAMVNRAKGAVAEVESYINETVLLSPIDGEISDIYPQRGELVGTGAPIMNVMDLTDMHVLFNVREDLMKDMKIGREIKAYMPALDREIMLKVIHMKDMGNYAAWKATKASGEYDLRTFQIKAELLEKINDIRPGMTVVVRRK
jgi:HlyD family secretion protein